MPFSIEMKNELRNSKEIKEERRDWIRGKKTSRNGVDDLLLRWVSDKLYLKNVRL